MGVGRIRGLFENKLEGRKCDMSGAGEVEGCEEAGVGLKMNDTGVWAA